MNTKQRVEVSTQVPSDEEMDKMRAIANARPQQQLPLFPEMNAQKRGKTDWFDLVSTIVLLVVGVLCAIGWVASL